MVNQNLFSSPAQHLPPADVSNEAGGPAYSLPPRQALAQLAATGTFGNVYYASGQAQLQLLRNLADRVNDSEFLAKLAVYARQHGGMKDMPAALLVMLSTRDTQLMHRIFHRVVDNGRVLRTVFQMVRSGQFGRRGLSSSLQRAFRQWLNDASAERLLSASIGTNPSLRDILRLARPTPKDNAQRALFGWLTDREPGKWTPATADDLPRVVRQLQAFRAAQTPEAQAAIIGSTSIRWDLLADAASGPHVWKAIARQMGPQALRMNVNTLLRHGVFGVPGQAGHADTEMIRDVAARLADPTAIRRAGQFPYQYLAAWRSAAAAVPQKIREALNEAAEIACGNVPELPGPVIIGLDTSGSMMWPVTGMQGLGRRSAMRCVDAAALFAAAVLRRQPDSVVIPFDTAAYQVTIDRSDSILSLADRLTAFGGGGTDCSQPLLEANRRFVNRPFAGVVLVSDNQSWICHEQVGGYGRRSATGLMSEWDKFRRTQQQLGVRDPKLICIDVAPYATTQAPGRSDILNVGGFSDAVFRVVSSFLQNSQEQFAEQVEAVIL